jgi:hypothetical protein
LFLLGEFHVRNFSGYALNGRESEL